MLQIDKRGFQLMSRSVYHLSMNVGVTLFIRLRRRMVSKGNKKREEGKMWREILRNV